MIMDLPKTFNDQEVHFDDSGPYLKVNLKCIKCGLTEEGTKRISVVDGKYTKVKGTVYDSSVIKPTKARGSEFIHTKSCPKTDPAEINQATEWEDENAGNVEVEASQIEQLIKYAEEVSLNDTDPASHPVNELYFVRDQEELLKEIETLKATQTKLPFEAETIIELVSLLDPRNKDISDSFARGAAWLFGREIIEKLTKQ
jgi:hypothetical protein